ncbi:hypothetical protein [Streptomyces sp. SPB4]|uniref:hypothetical protein n=1 Tax=Streptomyces sp. SPB4 TaxID=2940553 RepID=UPI002475A75E|nr:hypothetical protein [Streptomyces sp. SPB4]MDH6545533.1 hypothetical protein [Streptomyces sp. SPB4]GLX41133.1 hypothetical protein Sros01_72060 [Streptomyces roseochromogenus]
MNSLRAYLSRYEAGELNRQEMLDTVAAWPLEEPVVDPAHTLPTHQDNTADVLAAALLNGQISEDDYQEIARRRQQT